MIVVVMFLCVESELGINVMTYERNFNKKKTFSCMEYFVGILYEVFLKNISLVDAYKGCVLILTQLHVD